MRLPAVFGGIAILLYAAATVDARADALWNTPVYNPETKSYFELYSPDVETMKRGLNLEIAWHMAANLAGKRTFKGVPGRLAVVKTLQVHEFLKGTFKPDQPAWIGLRYWCNYRKLQWVTGEIYPVTSFARWGKIWNEGAVYPGQDNGKHAGEICKYTNDKGDYAGVHYWPIQHGFMWNANGRDKHFSAMFIEYPTGKE